MALVKSSQVWQLDFFIAGLTPKAKLAYDNLKKIFADANQTCKISVIDILINPKLAIENQIVVNPTIIRRFPLPKIVLVGDLTNAKLAIKKLGLK